MNQCVLKHSPILIGVLVSLTSAVWAQPPDVVQSDSNANTAMGTNVLLNNTSGDWNTASGDNAMLRNTTGGSNTASGVNALAENTTGSANTALGVETLLQNTSGYQNTAAGYGAMWSNSTGYFNVALGVVTLFSSTTGSYNTAVGTYALGGNSSGAGNIAIGFNAGGNLTTGSNNIDIGHPGFAGESGAIRIGVGGDQTQTFIAGIWGSPVTGSAVYVSSSGQLGVLASSERYKTDIQSMASSSARLDQLRPVTFRLRNELDGPIQYGLIAEEVARVYPELVIRARDGTIEGVRYEELTPMLLNEVQQQRRTLAAQQEHLAAQELRLVNQARQLETIERRLAEEGNLRTTAYGVECFSAQRVAAMSTTF